MEIGYPYKQLADIDISKFVKFTDKDHSAWPEKELDLRSSRFKTHEYTRSILFSWTERDTWPNIQPNRFDIWYENLESIIELSSHVSDRLPLNFMIAELKAKSEIHQHYDAHPFFAWARRIHVPLYVPAGVKFILDNVEIPLLAGRMFEISNTRMHRVINDSNESRYHIIMDFAP